MSSGKECHFPILLVEHLDWVPEISVFQWCIIWHNGIKLYELYSALGRVIIKLMIMCDYLECGINTVYSDG